MQYILILLTLLGLETRPSATLQWYHQYIWNSYIIISIYEIVTLSSIHATILFKIIARHWVLHLTMPSNISVYLSLIIVLDMRQSGAIDRPHYLVVSTNNTFSQGDCQLYLPFVWSITTLRNMYVHIYIYLYTIYSTLYRSEDLLPIYTWQSRGK